MATIYQLLAPEEAQYPSANFPQIVRFVGTNFPVAGLAYDATTDEAGYWRLVATSYGSGNLTLEIWWYADSGSSGNVVWQAQVAAITADTDTQDIETKALATLNFVQDTHLGTTVQRVHKCSITISNLDSLAADDLVYLGIGRDADSTNATDSMAGDAILVAARLSYSDT